MKILIQYLQEVLDISMDKAEEISKLIQEDRKGANYYVNVNILSELLENKAHGSSSIT